MSDYLVHVDVRKLPEGPYLATSSTLPGLVAQDDTLAGVLCIAMAVAERLIESYVQHGDEPLPVEPPSQVGPAVLRATFVCSGDECSMLSWVGDSCNVCRRIRNQHCGNRARRSAFRRSVARHMGITVAHQQLVNVPVDAELRISDYVKAGRWKYKSVPTRDEARDFQWYVIERLNPFFNTRTHTWDHARDEEYERLLEELLLSPDRSWHEFTREAAVSGVYVFFQDHRPKPIH